MDNLLIIAPLKFESFSPVCSVPSFSSLSICHIQFYWGGNWHRKLGQKLSSSPPRELCLAFWLNLCLGRLSITAFFDPSLQDHPHYPKFPKGASLYGSHASLFLLKRVNPVESSDLISILPEAMALDLLNERPGHFLIHALSLPVQFFSLLPETETLLWAYYNFST